MQKSAVFLYVSDNQLEIKILKSTILIALKIENKEKILQKM